ncbi:ankyrin repeat domain-containing protein [Glaciecola sp. MH2013]|uniref:ankyrin repeat domain-containing protein n=1 Tax=Glaciecola sp. MH2013 TaxID=2785524 RepID=UPI00189E0ED9|nr:ankyrin repeat domain-containing protein [Glaciecola sp. MH2013]MBF7073950.1 ankyrin repeat domain-containing protein [Glaciecola sp. MH2013]
MNVSLEDVLEEFRLLPAFVGIDLSGPNVKGNFGEYPLHVAVLSNNLDFVEVLLISKADINQKGEHGYAPLHESIEQENFEITKFLVEQGADLEIENNDGISSIEMIKNTKNKKWLELIEEA